jgi:hypothetical protein
MMINHIPKRISIKRLSSNEEGLAMTEFALILPILLMLSTSFIELAYFSYAHMRVNQIALSTADNSGRVLDQIFRTDIDAVMIGVRIAGTGIKFGQNGRVILSMVEPNGRSGADAGQMIRWQRCFGMKNVSSAYGSAGSGSTDASFANGFGPTGRKIRAQNVDGLMLAEAVYDYQPIFDINSSLINKLKANTIKYTATYPVRDRDTRHPTTGAVIGNIIQTGDPGITVNERLCTTFSAT